MSKNNKILLQTFFVTFLVTTFLTLAVIQHFDLVEPDWNAEYVKMRDYNAECMDMGIKIDACSFFYDNGVSIEVLKNSPLNENNDG